jgi:hypothetical protein
MGLAGCERKTDRSAVGIDNSVDFGVQAATETSYAAIVSIPFSRRRMLMNTDTGAVDHDDIAIESFGNRAQDMIPDTRLAPSHESVVVGCIRAISID